jgi:hypothetical protein
MSAGKPASAIGARSSGLRVCTSRASRASGRRAAASVLGEGLAAALHQDAQNGLLARRQRQRLAVQQKLTARGVPGQRPAGQAWMLDAARPPHQRMQPGFELGQREGLGEEVVGTGVESAHPFVHRVARRQDQRRQPLVAGTQALQHRVAVQARQAEVEHQRIVVVLLQGPVRQPAIVHPVDLDAGMLQRLAEPGAQRVFVFGEQDAHAGMLCAVGVSRA